MLSFLAFLLTIPAANWMIGHVGHCIPNGPCLIHVWPGIMAPSGVLMIGAALALRDRVHHLYGAQAAFGAILAGAAVSALLAPPALVLASVAAYVISEAADLAIYEPLRRRNQSAAVLASGLVGSVIDSALFLYLAFGSLQFMAGQVIGKLEATVLFAAIVFARAQIKEPNA